MNRGDRQEDIFQSEKDQRLFLETLGQAIEKPVERDWCPGGEEFRRELLAAVGELAGPQDAREVVSQFSSIVN
jgi:hypothetical protein